MYVDYMLDKKNSQKFVIIIYMTKYQLVWFQNNTQTTKKSIKNYFLISF